MSTSYVVFLTLAVSHLFLIALFFLCHYRRQRFASLVSLFFLCIIAYLMASIPGDIDRHGPIVEILLHRFGNATVLLLWIIAHQLFVDRQKISPIVWWFGATYMLLRAIGSTLSNFGVSFDPVSFFIIYAIPQIIMTGFVAHAFYLAIREYEVDLVLERRTERIAFVIGLGILIAMVTVNTTYRILNILFDISDEMLLLIPTQYYSIYLYLVIVSFFIWRFRLVRGSLLNAVEGLSPGGESQVATRKPGKENRKLIERVKHTMEVDKLFLKPKLTVATLADHIDSQEYKVRRVINQQLGFKNFSDFVNQYRIAEAARRLLETEESISSIGMDVGYVSLSSFHKAFKDKYEITPKEYRLRHPAP